MEELLFKEDIVYKPKSYTNKRNHGVRDYLKIGALILKAIVDEIEDYGTFSFIEDALFIDIYGSKYMFEISRNNRFKYVNYKELCPIYIFIPDTGNTDIFDHINWIFTPIKFYFDADFNIYCEKNNEIINNDYGNNIEFFLDNM